MATKNDGGSAGRRGKPAGQKPAPVSTQSQSQQPSSTSSDTSQAAATPQQAQQGGQAASSSPSTIRKGVYLSALIYVEGDQAPADDFNKLTTTTLKKALSACFAAPQDGLTMTLKSVNVKNNVEDEGEKFQF